jgi:hypothetical protein
MSQPVSCAGFCQPRMGRLGGLCVGDAARQAMARAALATYSARYEVPACDDADSRAGAARPARW